MSVPKLLSNGKALGFKWDEREDDGLIECDYCNGDGVIFKAPSFAAEQCPICFGRGRTVRRGRPTYVRQIR